jgi:hypothetical protein
MARRWLLGEQLRRAVKLHYVHYPEAFSRWVTEMLATVESAWKLSGLWMTAPSFQLLAGEPHGRGQ